TGPQDDLLVSLDVEVHDAGAAAERLLLAGIVADRWMAVLRTDLAREEHELLRAHPLGVHVGQELQPGLLESAEPEIGHLDRVPLGGCEHDAGAGQHPGGALPSFLMRHRGAPRASAPGRARPRARAGAP